MTDIVALLQLLNSLSPLGIIALLGVIIFMLVKGRKQVGTIKDNDLHALPEILVTLQRMEVSMGENFSWIKARLNGRS